MTKLNSTLRRVAIEDIQHNDRTFSTRSNDSPCPSLVRSIRRHGVIAPLVLQAVEDNRYRIVCGFRRCLVARELGLSTVPASVFVEPMDSLRLFEIAVAENLWAGALTDWDKSRVVGTLHDQFQVSREVIIDEYLELLGIKADRHHFTRYVSLSRLPEALQSRLSSVSMGTAQILARWPSEEREIYLETVERLHPTRSHRKELLQLLSDLRERSRRTPDESVAVLELWNSAGCAALLENSDLDRTAAIGTILDSLRRAYRPELDRMTRQYRQQVQDLNLPEGVRLRPPRFFEGGALEVRFSISSESDLDTVAGHLTRISRQPGLRRIFELL